MIIDEQYERIQSCISSLQTIAGIAMSKKHTQRPSEDALNQLQKATNELLTTVQSTISRFRKTGVFRYGLSEDVESET